MADFPIIYANWSSFFSSGNITSYFGHDNQPEHIKKYMTALNKDIKARNDEKIAKAAEEGREKPKLGKGPVYGPNELEPENTTCAIQLSQGMNAAGIKVPGLSIQRPNYAIPGGNGYYLHNVSEVTDFLTMQYGQTPNLRSLSNTPESAIKGRKGILTFGKMHTELYNGSSIVQSGAINQSEGHVTARMDPGVLWSQQDIRFWEIRPVSDKEKPGGGVGSFLNGWWTVYDGNYYFYYFSPPYVVYTKTRPAATAGAPYKSINRGTVKPGKENTYIVTWNPIPGDPEPTVETFWLIWGETRKMNAKSNKYGMLYAEKITPDE